MLARYIIVIATTATTTTTAGSTVKKTDVSLSVCLFVCVSACTFSYFICIGPEVIYFKPLDSIIVDTTTLKCYKTQSFIAQQPSGHTQ